ncbi:hypothetical protein [Hymenobacter mucosus]|uniref:Uncharacterized protein n=1 Tax=Hymenobacter mucosus TaxID=1411120 RepID=A0A238YW25_9BACT|nr:hypothetical protein [Hymenobacter mucosus]SNR75496.1 hypothetical protein SAMN06269173_106150 [Hymenobacter mucosus]
MKSFGLLTLLMLVGCALLQLIMPWWSLVLVCLGLAAWQRPSSGQAFAAGLLGAGLSWWLPALWLTTHGAARLAGRLATLLPLGGNAWLLLALSGVVAGLVGGLAAVSGTWLRQAASPTAAHSTAPQR